MKMRYFPPYCFYGFIVIFLVIFEKPCKILFALKSKVSEKLHFVFQVVMKHLKVMVQLHMTTVTGDFH